ncbi:hypothetical protein BD779DRAFT_1516055 [Infundibulicybe gibba]|nr:hypothetical protein BD779DRAFT_1516055 [Infundibulicybe gibba]
MSKPLSFAASRPVNPPGATPILTEAQVWKGLHMKARKPMSFVPAISSCDVVSDSGDKVVRSVRFGDAEPVLEAIELHEATIAYFEISSVGARITNVLSYDGDNNMLLTFTFANGIPGFEPGKGRPGAEELNKTIGKGVEHTIERIRQLAREGTLDSTQ